MLAFLAMDSVKNGKIALNRRRTVFENARFQVFADHIADTQGNEVLDFLVVAPRNRTGIGLTGIVVVPARAGEIFFSRVYRHPIGVPVLEAPRGFIDEGEEPAEAALRELNEETGLVCNPENLIPLGFFYPDPGVLMARVALFAAKDCETGGEPLGDEIGIDEGIWIPLSEVRRMLRDHEVEEASTCVALHRYFESIPSP
jgi:ADP-ribose pyrophosphatase